MALNTIKCNYLTPAHFKGLTFCACSLVCMVLYKCDCCCYCHRCSGS